MWRLVWVCPTVRKSINIFKRKVPFEVKLNIVGFACICGEVSRDGILLVQIERNIHWSPVVGFCPIGAKREESDQQQDTGITGTEEEATPQRRR